MDALLFFQGPDIRLILTWGPSPPDLDSYVKFFDANGTEQCKLSWYNKACGDYATLDVDEKNVRKNKYISCSPDPTTNYATKNSSSIIILFFS